MHGPKWVVDLKYMLGLGVYAFYLLNNKTFKAKNINCFQMLAFAA